MEDFHNLLKWCIKNSAVNLLEISEWPEEGYKEVIVHNDNTFYGINPMFSWKNLESVQSAAEARNLGYLSDDFPDTAPTLSFQPEPGQARSTVGRLAGRPSRGRPNQAAASAHQGAVVDSIRFPT